MTSSIKLTWDDLLIQGFSQEVASAWLQPWAPLLSGPVSPIFLSKFGDWFLRLPNGSVQELSVLEGQVTQVASSQEEFSRLVNSQLWQEEHLLSWHVLQLHERGIIPQAGECYALVPHPSLTGSIDVARAMVMSVGAWQAICAQLLVGSHTNA